MRIFSAALAAVVATLVMVAPARAVLINYEMTGALTGRLGGSPFVALYQFNMTADRDNVSIFGSSPVHYQLTLSSGSLLSPLPPIVFGSPSYLGLTSFADVDFNTAGLNVFGFHLNPIGNYKVLNQYTFTAVGTDVYFDEDYFSGIFGKRFRVFGASSVVFTASIAAVPEPSTWAMMLLGFAGVAFASYRRARKIQRVLVAT